MGGTYKAKQKILKKEQDDLFITLAKAIASLRNPEEVAYFLRDLLSEAEVFMISRRLRIAELLIEGLTYEQITKQLKVSHGTIARVQTWLDSYGDGFRAVIDRIEKHKKTNGEGEENSSYSRLKKRYPMYHWPELLLKEIIKSANRRERERLLTVVSQLKEKTKLTRDLKRLLNF